jgi:hypothetical protein
VVHQFFHLCVLLVFCVLFIQGDIPIIDFFSKIYAVLESNCIDLQKYRKKYKITNTVKILKGEKNSEKTIVSCDVGSGVWFVVCIL